MELSPVCLGGILHTPLLYVKENPEQRQGRYWIVAKRRRREWGRGWVETRTRASGVRYVARWREGEATRSHTLPAGASEADAWDWLDDRARAERRGVAAPDRTVDDAVTLWREQRESSWSSATRYTYARLVRLHVEPWFGGRRLSALTSDEMRLWVDGALPEAVAVMRSVLGVATREGWIAASPMRSVAVPQRKRRKYQVWSTTECKVILGAVKDDLWWRAFYAVMLSTGVRRGEILSLMWSDVDLDGATVLVRSTVTTDERGRPIQGETTKGKRTRRIALNRQAVDALKRLPERTGYVLSRHGDMASRGYVNDGHRRWCRIADVRPIRVHDIRHTVATILLDAGVPVKVVSDMLGHGSAVTTMDIYQHATAEMHRAAVGQLGDLFED